MGTLGVHNVLSLPLALPGQVVDVYVHRDDVFGAHAVALGELFTQNSGDGEAQRTDPVPNVMTMPPQLHTGPSTPPVINQAIVPARGRSGRGAGEGSGWHHLTAALNRPLVQHRSGLASGAGDDKASPRLNEVPGPSTIDN